MMIGLSLKSTALAILMVGVLPWPTLSLAQELPALDVIVEGDTYVPYFYAGRAEPTVGNDMRLVAISASDTTPSSYRWRVGNQYASSTDPYLRLSLPLTGQRIMVEVTALNSVGEPLGRATEYIESSEPRMLFYEDNALRGTSKVALSDTFILVGDEALVKAEPYFAGTEFPSTLQANWSSNLIIEPVKDDWRFLYIRRGETNRTSGEVQLRVANPENINEYLSNSFNVSL